MGNRWLGSVRSRYDVLEITFGSFVYCCTGIKSVCISIGCDSRNSIVGGSRGGITRSKKTLFRFAVTKTVIPMENPRLRNRGWKHD